MALCMNCSILLRSNLQIENWALELSPDLLLIAEEWCGHDATNSDRLCQECVILMAREAENRSEGSQPQQSRQLGHTDVCLSCGISVGRRTGRRRHRLHDRSVEIDYIANQIFPRQIPDEAFVCHPCWVRAHTNIAMQPAECDDILTYTTDDWKQDRCINCGISFKKLLTRYSNVSSLQQRSREILQHWTGCTDLTEHCICINCDDIIEEILKTSETNIPERSTGHREVCVGCGMSTLRNRQIVKLKEHEIPYALKHWPWYNILKDREKICCKCSLSLHRMVEMENRPKGEVTKRRKHSHDGSVETIGDDLESSADDLKYEVAVPKTGNRLHEIVKKLGKSNSPTLDFDTDNIILSNGKRTPVSSSRCVISGCVNTTRKKVPRSKQRLLATSCNVLLSKDSRACKSHVSFDKNDNEELIGQIKSLNNFTLPQFETFVDVMKQGMVVIDFENVEAMPDHICKYWTGLRVAQFVKMYEGMKKKKLMKSALAVYLIKKLTGDSEQKLAKLFSIDSKPLRKQVAIVKKHFA